MTTPGGISEAYRRRLDELHRRFPRPFTVAEASEALTLDRVKTRRLLAHLAARGWLSRVRANAYVTVPLGAERPSEWREDPWVVAAHLFEPCYLAGWTACEHWGLTEQIFRDVRVVSAGRIRNRREEIQGTTFLVKVVSPERLFGTRAAWRGQTQIQISDPPRTIVDLLDDPAMGGGMRTVAEILSAYFESDLRDDRLLSESIEQFGNRSVWKRLGYLIETLAIEAPELLRRSAASVSAGISVLDPGAPRKGRTLKRWNLLVNVDLERPVP